MNVKAKRNPQIPPVTATPVLPLGALMLAASVGSWAQAVDTNKSVATLETVTVREKAMAPEGKDSVQAVETTIGKGKQALRDIPQSVTVVTEKLINDRNLDTVKEALKNTAGITFQAAEGGEEDIRLRGFALQQTGDLYIDGMRDPAIYDRDTFNFDRLEVLRGSASMLFGRGSTGGIVNQVSKPPNLNDENQMDITVGNHQHLRFVTDLNKQTSDNAALRINAMVTKANNDGAGNRIDKSGLALAYRAGMGERHEIQTNFYHLTNDNGVNYGMPWLTPASDNSTRQLLPVDPATYYGLASDYNHSGADIATLGHVYRPDADTELTTRLRWSQFERDLRAGTVRLANGTTSDTLTANTVISRGTQLKVQDMQVGQFQSDLSRKFEAWGKKHHVLAGIDVARESKTVYGDAPGLGNATSPTLAAFRAALGLTKPNTLFGTPNDGAAIDESARQFLPTSDYTSNSLGLYAQDTMNLTSAWKLVGGLRYDHMEGKYNTYNYGYTGTGMSYANFTHTGGSNYQVKLSELSKRLGVLYQPNDLQSYYFSAGNSFNPSGDLYSLGAGNTNTPPEQSLNLELGAKLDTSDKRFTTRVAVFHATKYNERNTDPLVTVDDGNGGTTPLIALSGKRHAAGLEIDFSGRLTPRLEVFASYMWMPIAKVDQAAPCPSTGACSQGAIGERAGDRPAFTPKYSGTAWGTYQLNAEWRVGAGLNFRGKQTPNRVAWFAPSFVTGDVMAEYKVDGSDQYIFKLNISNVTNKLYADQLYTGHYVPGAGRLIQLTSSIRF